MTENKWIVGDVVKTESVFGDNPEIKELMGNDVKIYGDARARPLMYAPAPPHNMFAVQYECKEAGTMVKEGTKVWLATSPWGVTSHINMDADLMIFSSEEQAHEFMETWEGHPWCFQFNGNYEVVPVKPVYEQVLVRYERDMGV